MFCFVFEMNQKFTYFSIPSDSSKGQKIFSLEVTKNYLFLEYDQGRDTVGVFKTMIYDWDDSGVRHSYKPDFL